MSAPPDQRLHRQQVRHAPQRRRGGGRLSPHAARSVWCALLAACCAPASAAGPAEPAVLPLLRQAVQQAPALQAAAQGLLAEQHQQRQQVAAAQAWTGALSAARRTQSSPSPESGHEWELTLERPWRLPGKAQVLDNLGQARQAAAQAQQQRVQRELGRQGLQQAAAWLRERAGARLWANQLALLQHQQQTVQRRQQLGDAARLEAWQAEAAATQAQAQARAASDRAAAAREALAQLLPELDLDALARAADSAPAAVPDSDWLATQLAASTELAQARRDSELAQAQLRLDQAEQRPDPLVGVRVGTARNGAERVLGFTLSLPLGGEARSAGAAASQARWAAAQAQAEQARRQAQADAVQRWREAQTQWTLWQGQQQAAGQVQAVAERLARGYALGEGSLSELLAARRLAVEQQLAAAQAATDAHAALWRLHWEADSAAAVPGSVSAAPNAGGPPAVPTPPSGR